MSAFNPTTGKITVVATGITKPVDLDVGPDGSLYLLSNGHDARVCGSITPGNSGAIRRGDGGANFCRELLRLL